VADWAALPAPVRVRALLMWRGDLAVMLIGDTVLLVLAAALRHYALLALTYFSAPGPADLELIALRVLLDIGIVLGAMIHTVSDLGRLTLLCWHTLRG
jgi:hypothetical protein